MGSKRLFKLKDGSLCFARFFYEIFKCKCKLVEQGVISSYSQRVHEVQLGRQVRRNHPHPGGENRKHFIGLQLFHASTDYSRSIMQKVQIANRNILQYAIYYKNARNSQHLLLKEFCYCALGSVGCVYRTMYTNTQEK